MLRLRRRGRAELHDLLRDHSQADLVLCLLRVGTRSALASAEQLIGKPITHCPPQLRRDLPSPAHRRGDHRILLAVGSALRERSSSRMHCARPGMSVVSLMMRGATRRDIRLALRFGLIQLEIT